MNEVFKAIEYLMQQICDDGTQVKIEHIELARKHLLILSCRDQSQTKYVMGRNKETWKALERLVMALSLRQKKFGSKPVYIEFLPSPFDL